MNSPLTLVVLQVESMKHAFGVRLALGDPGTDERPQANISAALEMAQNISFAAELR